MCRNPLVNGTWDTGLVSTCVVGSEVRHAAKVLDVSVGQAGHLLNGGRAAYADPAKFAGGAWMTVRKMP